MKTKLLFVLGIACSLLMSCGNTSSVSEENNDDHKILVEEGFGNLVAMASHRKGLVIDDFKEVSSVTFKQSGITQTVSAKRYSTELYTAKYQRRLTLGGTESISLYADFYSRQQKPLTQDITIEGITWSPYTAATRRDLEEQKALRLFASETSDAIKVTFENNLNSKNGYDVALANFIDENGQVAEFTKVYDELVIDATVVSYIG